MTIIEGNKLIAEFMGIRVITDEELQYDFDNPRLNVWNIGSIRYHSSWDWLMPVWFKILNWNKSEFGIYYTQEISQDAILFKDKNDRGFKFIHLFLPTQKIETPIIPIWESVVGFIQWYNSQTKNIEK